MHRMVCTCRNSPKINPSSNMNRSYSNLCIERGLLRDAVQIILQLIMLSVLIKSPCSSCNNCNKTFVTIIRRMESVYTERERVGLWDRERVAAAKLQHPCIPHTNIRCQTWYSEDEANVHKGWISFLNMLILKVFYTYVDGSIQKRHACKLKHIKRNYFCATNCKLTVGW